MSVIHLAANSRLTQTLKQSAFNQQIHAVAETPLVMTLSQWWSQWEQACLLRGELPIQNQPQKVLSAFEAQMIWEELLETESQKRLDENGQPLDLLNLSSTAKQLYQAWSFWMEWLTDEQQALTQDQHFDADEIELFKSCMQAYQTRLKKHHWQDEVLHQQQRLTWLQEGKGKHTLPTHFELHGFDEISPQMTLWQQTVEKFGCKVTVHLEPIQTQTKQCAIYAALDHQDEVQQVALWCVQQWRQRKETQPAQSIKIGVVAPNLGDYKAPLTRALNEQLTLAQQQHLPLNEKTPESLFNFSLGHSLLDLPLVQNAMLTLKLFCQPHRSCSYSDWSEWLISPYSMLPTHVSQAIDAKLRRLQWASFKWPNLLDSEVFQKERSQQEVIDKSKKSTEKKRTQTQNLLDILTGWHKQLEEKNLTKMGVSSFVKLVSECLKQVGWCSSRGLNSDEYQQQKAFNQTLERFSTLTETQGEQSFSYWFMVLKRFVGEAVHQSQSKGVQPIQVMGMLEAGGQSFDALWVMGLTDEAWPRMPNPNPFLPMLLQRSHQMPRCDAQKELQYAKHVTERLAHSAEQQVWSYARTQGEAELLISPLLETERFQAAEAYVRQSYQSLSKASFSKRAELNWVLDNRGPEVPAGTKAPGGTGILQAQSQCPLMAFIDYRLGARNGLQAVEDGLQMTNQGTLIHEILEHFWKETKTQSNLLILNDEEVQQRLNQHIQTSFENLQKSFDEHYLQLEQARIFELLLQWMELEKQRPSFAVLSTEKEKQITLAGIEFKVIVDRIDVVDGQKVILDYKTGRANANNLLKTPIKAPQLAVYLIKEEESDNANTQDTTDIFGDVSGLGYGLLHSDDGVKISAVVEDESVFASKARSIQVFSKLSAKEGGDFYEVAWSDFLASLRQEVTDLALSIQQGVADMNFDKPTDIAYAAGHLALRLPEVAMQQAEVELFEEESV